MTSRRWRLRVMRYVAVMSDFSPGRVWAAASAHAALPADMGKKKSANSRAEAVVLLHRSPPVRQLEIPCRFFSTLPGPGAARFNRERWTSPAAHRQECSAGVPRGCRSGNQRPLGRAVPLQQRARVRFIAVSAAAPSRVNVSAAAGSR